MTQMKDIFEGLATDLEVMKAAIVALLRKEVYKSEVELARMPGVSLFWEGHDNPKQDHMDLHKAAILKYTQWITALEKGKGDRGE